MNDERPAENRFSRWSKRKQALREAEISAKTEPDILSAAEMEENQKALEKQHQSNREAAEAIDLESLDDSSDFTAFMKDGVPDALRRKAYRLLWKSNPILANVDGLNDYDEDFADASMIMETFQSAWNVERGYEPAPTDPAADVAPADPEETELQEETAAADAVDPPGQTAPVEDNRDISEDAAPALDEDTEIAAANLKIEERPAEELRTAAPEVGSKISLRQRLMLDG